MNNNKTLESIKNLLREKYPSIEKEKLEKTAQRIQKSCEHIYLHLDNIILTYKKEKQWKQ